MFSMKDFWKKHKKRIGIIVAYCIAAMFFIFAVPLIVSCAYKTPATLPIFAMSWEAKDVLAFYGSLLGAGATIFAVVVTIKSTEKNQKEQQKLSTKPYLETEKYFFTTVDNIPFDEKDIIFLNVCKNKITYQGSMPKEIDNIQIFADIIGNPPLKQFFNKPLFSYTVFNYGSGNAINIELNINNQQALQNFCVSTDKPKKLIFILDNDLFVENDKTKSVLKIQFKYSDSLSLASYRQTESIEFIKNKNDEIKMHQTSSGLLTKPEECKTSISD